MEAFFNPPEDKINFETFMQPSTVLFRLVFFGFEPIRVDATRREKFVYRAKIAYFITCIVTFIFAIASMITFLVVNWDNFVDASRNIPNALSALIIGLKALLTFYHKQDYREMFQEFSEMFSNRAMDNKKHKVKKHLVEFLRLMKFFAGPCVFSTSVVFITIFPYLYNGTMMKPTIDFWYPFDVYQLENYPFAWFWAVWAAFNFIIYFLACDSMFYGLITALVMEFDVLKTDFTEVMMVSQDERKKHFVQLISRHNKLLNLCDKLQNIYSLTFLLCVFFSSLMLCFVAFALSTTSDIDTNEYLFSISGTGIVGGQIGLLCIYGQKLIDSSESLAIGMYDCGWETLDDNLLKKQMILVMIRSQRASRLTAMGFAVISLETFAQASF